MGMEMSDRIKVVRMVRTCHACPAQWDGWTDDNRPVYVRFRWSHGYVVVGEPWQDIDTLSPFGPMAAEWGNRDKPNGYLTYDELKAAVPSIDWPDTEEGFND